MIQDELIFNEPDAMLRMTVANDQARVMLCRCTRMTQQAADIHQASDVAAAAMGRMLAGCAMLSCMIKETRGSVTVIANGDGVGGRVTVVGRGGDMKIAPDAPQAELPLRADGKQDVGGYIGNNGKLTVIKDMGQGEPYIGISNLISGELGEDFAEYFTMSEQVPSLVALGCLNQDGVVLSAGGILIQALPGCTEKVLQQLELREPFFSGISRELFDRGLRGLAESWFDGMDLKILAEDPLHLTCDCSRYKMEAALLALTREDLREMSDSLDDTVMVCHFCRTEHRFSPARVEELLHIQEEKI